MQQIVGTEAIPAACSALVDTSSAKPAPGYRVEFGNVAVPPGVVQRNQIIPDDPGIHSWPYAQKAGFMFLGSGPPAVLSIPAGWQKVVALGTPYGPASSLHMPSCPMGSRWNTDISLFYLRSPTACVPLRIQTGRHATTVWFGLGRRCGS
jgi:hypothetical protein